VLLAVIFCVDSAPDKQMSARLKYSRNNSVAFSRICVILQIKTPCWRHVYEGEVGWVKSRLPMAEAAAVFICDKPAHLGLGALFCILGSGK
jgi:hypothetical protein